MLALVGVECVQYKYCMQIVQLECPKHIGEYVDVYASSTIYSHPGGMIQSVIELYSFDAAQYVLVYKQKYKGPEHLHACHNIYDAYVIRDHE